MTRLLSPDLKCYECGKKFCFDELETITRDGKEYWVCPNCDMEMPVVDKVFSPEGASGFKRNRH